MSCSKRTGLGEVDVVAALSSRVARHGVARRAEGAQGDTLHQIGQVQRDGSSSTPCRPTSCRHERQRVRGSGGVERSDWWATSWSGADVRESAGHPLRCALRYRRQRVRPGAGSAAEAACAPRHHWRLVCDRALDDVVGQAHLVGPGCKPLRRLVEQDRLTSAIFWGPPGTGKTTLALAVAGTTKRSSSSARSLRA